MANTMLNCIESDCPQFLINDKINTKMLLCHQVIYLNDSEADY